MNEKTTQLLARTFRFGVDVLKFLSTLPYKFIYKVSMLQVSRCSTSIGANYEEAQGVVSKRNSVIRLEFLKEKPEKVLIG